MPHLAILRQVKIQSLILEARTVVRTNMARNSITENAKSLLKTHISFAIVLSIQLADNLASGKFHVFSRSSL